MQRHPTQRRLAHRAELLPGAHGALVRADEHHDAPEGNPAGDAPTHRSIPTARAPRKVSPFVVWLCTDAARNVNGRTFHVYGDFVARYSEPEDERIIYAAGGWDLDALDAAAPELTSDLTNDYTLDEYPALKVFDE